MPVDTGAAGFQLGIEDAPQADRQAGRFRREHVRVGNKRRVARQAMGVRLEELLDALAADFLLALHDDPDVHGEPSAASLHQRLEGLHVHEDLPLVVRRAPRVDILVTDMGLEGRCLPLVNRIDGLYVVVAVAQNRRLAFGVKPVGVDHRVAIRGDDFHVLKARALQVFGHEPGRALDVGLVFGQRRDAGYAEHVEQFVQKAPAVRTRELTAGERSLIVFSSYALLCEGSGHPEDVPVFPLLYYAGGKMATFAGTLTACNGGTMFWSQLGASQYVCFYCDPDNHAAWATSTITPPAFTPACTTATS